MVAGWWARGIAGVVLALPAAGCGGSSGGLASGPPPLPTPAPAPAQPVASAPTTAMIVPTQVSDPPVSEATGGMSFRSSGNRLLPLTQTVVSGNFDGDAAGTARSAHYETETIEGTAGVGFRSGNVTRYASSYSPRDVEQLDWTRFGHWIVYAGDAETSGIRQAGAWSAGFQTPVAAIPTSGKASYAGKAFGLYSEQSRCQCASAAMVSGNVAMSADFAARTVSGSISDLWVTSTGYASGETNQVAFTASWAAGRNQFSGTTFVSSSAYGTLAFSDEATGAITGHFYGPGAEEAGAAWTLADATRRMIGSFGVKRQ